MKYLSLSLVALLWGCAGMMYGSAPVQRTVVVPLMPDQAYQRSTLVLTHQFAARLEFQDRQTRTAQGILKNAARLTVTVTPHPEGSSVHITGTVLPNKVVIGAFTEVDDVAQRIEEDAALYALSSTKIVH